jgi:hypothetical protein
LAVCSTTFLLLFAGFAGAAVAPSAEQRRTAGRWAEAREGTVAWAVIDSAGDIHGRHATRRFASASVSKAFLLVAALRRVGGGRPLPPDLARLLGPMVRRSDNDAAHVVHRRLGGDAAIAAVARAARMRRVAFAGGWSNVQVSAGDVARFFHVADRLVPRRHRAYARGLLERVDQDWGVPRALRRHRWRVLFKGGWRARLVHQGALVERDGERLALAILTDHSPSHEYGRRTLEGVARRLLGA